LPDTVDDEWKYYISSNSERIPSLPEAKWTFSSRKNVYGFGIEQISDGSMGATARYLVLRHTSNTRQVSLEALYNFVNSVYCRKTD
jgi:hypothetical protein